MRRTLAILSLVALALAAGPGTALASNLGPGGGARIRVGDQMVGPYQLYVTTAPEPAQPGTLTIVVRVTDPKSGSAVKDATINARLVGEDGTTLTAAVTHKDAGNPTEYAAHIPIDKTGAWEATVSIEGPAGPAQVQFTQRIDAPRTVSTLLIAGLPFIVALGVLGGLWFVRSGKRGEATDEDEAATEPDEAQLRAERRRKGSSSFSALRWQIL